MPALRVIQSACGRTSSLSLGTFERCCVNRFTSRAFLYLRQGREINRIAHTVTRTHNNSIKKRKMSNVSPFCYSCVMLISLRYVYVCSCDERKILRNRVFGGTLRDLESCHRDRESRHRMLPSPLPLWNPWNYCTRAHTEASTSFPCFYSTVAITRFLQLARMRFRAHDDASSRRANHRRLLFLFYAKSQVSPSCRLRLFLGMPFSAVEINYTT
jgi:hypothetical protein